MKLAVHGYGNMGRAVEKVATERGHQIVAVMTSSKKAKVSGAEVIIDFSNASGVDDAVALACDNHIDLVIGTTGWNDRLDKLRARVDDARIGCVYASNFSTGVVLFEAIVAQAAKLFAPHADFSAFLHEAHHAAKKDAPSGTALLLKKTMEQSGFPRPIDVSSTRMLMAHGFLRRLFEVFERFKTAVDVVTTSEVSVSVTVDDTRRLEAILDNLRNFADASCEREMAIICAVGENLRADPTLFARAVTSLERIPLRLVSQAASRRNITFVLRNADVPHAMMRLHEAFF